MLFGAPTRARAILSPILAALKPSFLRRSSHTAEPRRLHRTSYLDGLRGVAALFVVFAHYEATYFPSLNPAWHAGLSGDASAGGAEGVEHHSNSNFLQLPIVRAMYAGPFMVAIFFVISGHVLSQKALGLAKRRLYSDLLKSLASSVFRRWFRLMLPALASSFLFFLFVQCGWVTKLSPNWDADHAPVSEPLYDPKDETLSSWAADVLSLTNPFRFGEVSFPKYNYPLWTMPVEYMGSMIIFVVVTGTSLVRPVLRLAVLATLVVYCMWMARWEWCLFISGVLLADVYDKSSPDYAPIPMLPLTSCIDGEVEENTRHTSKSCMKTLPKPSSYIVESFLFLLALYLGSAPTGIPAELDVAPGYSWLSPWIPRSWALYMSYFYPDVGAILLVSVLAHSDFLQRIFTTRIAQYLGDISLSLYMLHVLVLHTLGNWLIVQCWVTMQPLGSWGFTIGISIALSCCAIVTFWLSDVFWRLVDTRCVQLTRWMTTMAFVKDEQPL